MHKLDLEKAEEPEIKLPTIHRITEKAREFQKYIYFCFTDYARTYAWTARRSNQSINPEYSSEELMLKPKLQYFGHLMQRADS